jgi:WD40 repeat protein
VLLLAAGGVGAAAGFGAAAAGAATFGSEGERAGQFVRPEGLAVDEESGDLLLVDRGNARVERFSGDGAFQLAWGWGVADGHTPELQTCSATCFAGLEGPGAGQFVEPAGAAVDNSLGLSAGDVYVVDRGNSRVEKFSPAGEFLLMIGGEVNATTHANVCAVGEQCQAGVPVAGNGSFEVLANNAVAVDSAGTVYVGERERMQKFGPEGAFVGEVALPGVGVIESLLVDASGDLYVMASGVQGVHKYDATGTELGSPRDPTAESFPSNIALGAAGELFVYNGEQEHVFEYDSSGAQISSFVETGGSRGMAYSPSAHVLYVLHDTVVSALTPPPPGPVVVAGSESVSEVTPTSATANALVNPEGPTETTYHFEYGQTTSYGSSTAAVALSGEPFADQPATGELVGLSPDTVYHFRVVVTNAASETTFGADQTFTTSPAVSIESESVSQVTASSARLSATLDGHGLDTEYRFEYGRTQAYGSSAPVPDGDAGVAGAGTDVSVLVQGLEAGATYHYRVVAHNALGTVPGPDQTFVTATPQSFALPDGRGWEMVSPADKHGAPLEGIAEEGGVIQAAEGGEALTYIAKGPVDTEPAGSRSVLNSQILARRSGQTWTTTDLTTPHEEPAFLVVGDRSEYRLFTGDLSQALVEPAGKTPLNPALMGAEGERTPYRREADGEYLPLVTASNVPPGTKFQGEEITPGSFAGGVHLVSATPDERTVVLSSQQTLTEGFTGAGHVSLYEWNAGTLTLLSILPNNHAAAEEGEEASLGNNSLQVRHALSPDGSRAIFEAESEGTGHLYMRDVALGETVQLDTPVGVKASGGKPTFQDASVDGSRVYFTDTARLTVDATAKAGEPDLYLCTMSITAEHLSCALEDLTVDETANEAANVLGDVIGVGDAGNHVYFVANGALAAGAVHGDCVGGNPSESPASAVCNVYVRDVASRSTRLVAVLANRDAVDWKAGAGENLGEMTARVSPNGRFLAFMSQRSLTGYDNRDASSGAPDEEVYLFDEAASPPELRCVSCDASGARPAGVFDSGEAPGLLVDRPLLWHQQWLAASIPGWTRVDLGRALYQSRYLSDSGRLFFNSAEGLVPSDANGREDVYEFEPGGVGGCTVTSGCVALVSSGDSGEEAAFLDASTTGDDVFFMTSAKLAPSDVDGAFDIYDAHVCTTSIPCPVPPASVTPACTTADSCRPAPVPQPDIFGAAPSATFSGSGNLASGAPPKPKPLTRAQKLARALKACKKKPKKRRAACRARARRLYGASHRAKRIAAKRGRGK